MNLYLKFSPPWKSTAVLAFAYSRRESKLQDLCDEATWKIVISMLMGGLAIILLELLCAFTSPSLEK